MKTLTVWAARNPIKSRFLIAFAQILLITISILWGVLLFQWNVEIPLMATYLGLTIIALIAILYPSKNYHFWKLPNHFGLRKKLDISLLIAISLTITCLSNQTVQDPVQVQFIVQKERNAQEFSFRKLHKKQKKWLKTQLKSIVKTKTKEKASFGQVVGIFFSILGALLLIFLIAGLSCSLSCSGSEALALLVFIGGVVGVIFLLVRTIRRILRDVIPKNEINIDPKDPDGYLYDLEVKN